jgi:phosphoribosyl 1,2-cyclic phosphodiesterase
MLKLASLSSGSCGNAILVATGKTKILVDAGTTLNYLGSSLGGIDIRLDEIDAILLTHEHTDHIRSAAAVSRRFGVPVYGNELTLDALPANFHAAEVRVFPTGRTFEIGDLAVEAVPHSHDCREPVGFVLYHQERKACIATDLGYVTDEVRAALTGADLIMLEANHDLEMLARSRYPRFVKTRIAGECGHLSNIAAGNILATTASGRAQKVLLAHLSKESNEPEIALSTVRDILVGKAVDSLSLMVAGRLDPSPVLVV